MFLYVCVLLLKYSVVKHHEPTDMALYIEILNIIVIIIFIIVIFF